MDFLEELAWRGQIHQQTNPEGLRAHLAGGVRRAYCGFDPTASSLTIGNLVPIMMLVRLQRAGHQPVVVFGGGTGLIGDPSGKEAERPLMDPETIATNVAAQQKIFERLLDFSGPRAAIVANNLDWLGKLGWLEALRDVGKHFSVNMMIQKESVRARLEQREQGISYTEFSYMLLQAYDFLHLHDTYGVTLQVAGSDQWGNIVAGIDLIRRVRGVETFGLTAPLITKSDGGKFGKTESGAIWLTEDRTSPYAFYQFWLNSADADVPRYLRTFTLFTREEIDALVAELEASPAGRKAHRALAAHMTELVHGKEALSRAERTTAALFSGEVRSLSKADLEAALGDAPTTTFPRDRLAGGIPVVDFLVETQAVSSKREARELVGAGAIQVSGSLVAAETRIDGEWFLHGEFATIRRGKKTWRLVRLV